MQAVTEGLLPYLGGVFFIFKGSTLFLKTLLCCGFSIKVHLLNFQKYFFFTNILHFPYRHVLQTWRRLMFKVFRISSWTVTNKQTNMLLAMRNSKYSQQSKHFYSVFFSLSGRHLAFPRLKISLKDLQQASGGDRHPSISPRLGTLMSLHLNR